MQPKEVPFPGAAYAAYGGAGGMVGEGACQAGTRKTLLLLQPQVLVMLLLLLGALRGIRGGEH